MPHFAASLPVDEVDTLHALAGEFLHSYTTSGGRVVEFTLGDSAPDGLIEQIEGALHRPFRGQPYVDLTADRIERMVVAARIATADTVRSGELDNATIAVLAPLYPDWQPNLTVGTGDIYQWDGTLVECLQGHTTQEGWEPDHVPALWKIHRSPDLGAQPWVQPAGAHDAYQIGEQVTHNERLWECSVANNVWEPGMFGWTDIGAAE